MSVAAAAWCAVVLAASARALVPRRAPRPGTKARAVTILRPCAGSEPELARCLASRPRTTAVLDVRVAVESASDPAYAAACASGARVILTGARGPNHKADQLARALAAAEPHDVVVVADSDVDLEGVDLDALVAPLGDPGVAAAWAPPVEIAPRTLADRASAAVLAGSLHAFALLARLDPRGMCGKLFAVRASELSAVGGFASLVDRLGEDMELARRLTARGLRVVCADVVAPSRASGRSVAQVVRRYARWLAVIRAQRPWLLASYPLLFAPVPLLVPFALATGAPLVAAVALVARLGVGVAARRASRQRLSPYDLLADPLLLAAFAVALSTRTVRWRHASLRLRGGRAWLDQEAS